MKLGYLGPNTNSENAAQKYAAKIAGLKIQSYPSMDYVFKALKLAEVDRIIVPVRNSITGDIAYKKIAGGSDFIKIDEISVLVGHYLATRNGEIRFIASHPEVLKQCASYLNKKYACLSRIEVESTNEAAKLASIVSGMAAIANLETCLAWDLKIIEKDIVKDNYSTFWVLESKRYF